MYVLCIPHIYLVSDNIKRGFICPGSWRYRLLWAYTGCCKLNLCPQTYYQLGRSQTDSSWLSLSHCRHYRQASSCPPASSLLLVFVLVLWDKDTILFLILFLLWSWEPNPSALPLNSKYSTIELSLQPPRCLSPCSLGCLGTCYVDQADSNLQRST